MATPIYQLISFTSAYEEVWTWHFHFLLWRLLKLHMLSWQPSLGCFGITNHLTGTVFQFASWSLSMKCTNLWWLSHLAGLKCYRLPWLHTRHYSVCCSLWWRFESRQVLGPTPLSEQTRDPAECKHKQSLGPPENEMENRDLIWLTACPSPPKRLKHHAHCISSPGLLSGRTWWQYHAPSVGWNSFLRHTKPSECQTGVDRWATNKNDSIWQKTACVCWWSIHTFLKCKIYTAFLKKGVKSTHPSLLTSLRSTRKHVCRPQTTYLRTVLVHVSQVFGQSRQGNILLQVPQSGWINLHSFHSVRLDPANLTKQTLCLHTQTSVQIQ